MPTVSGVVRRALLSEQFLVYLITVLILYFSNSGEESFEYEFLGAGALGGGEGDEVGAGGQGGEVEGHVLCP